MCPCGCPTFPTSLPVTPELACLRPGLQALSVVWLPGWPRVAPTQPPVSGRATQGPFVGFGKINKQPRAVETSPVLQVQTDRAWAERDPRRGRLREQAAACVQGADQTPSGRREAGGDRCRLCLMGQSREREPPWSPPNRGFWARSASGEWGARRPERRLPLPHWGTLAGLACGSGPSLSRQGPLTGSRQLSQEASDRAPLHKPPWHGEGPPGLSKNRPLSLDPWRVEIADIY